MRSTIQHAGTFHVATGNWTGSSGALAPLVASPEMVVYDNTSPSITGQFFFAMQQGETLTDEGRVPSTSGPTSPSALIPGGFDESPGCQDAYTISRFRIAYCTDQTSVSLAIGFQDAYTLCAPPASQHVISLTGLPASPTVGFQTCWSVDVDLSGSPASFVMAADGDGTYAGTPADNLFGWSFTVTSPVATGGYTGTLISGAFTLQTGTDGTRWDDHSASPAPIWPWNSVSGPGGGPELGTGMSTQDFIRYDGPGGSGCTTLGSVLPSTYLVLYSSDACPPPPAGTPFCFGDATSSVPCPCSNAGLSGHGCDNSVASGGAQLGALGVPLYDDVVLNVAGELPNATSIFLQGTIQLAAPIAFGDGLRCAGGQLKRLYVKTAQAGQASAPGPSDPSISQRSLALGDPIAPGSQRCYQVYYRDPSGSFCPPPAGNTWNISNALAISW